MSFDCFATSLGEVSSGGKLCDSAGGLVAAAADHSSFGVGS